MNEPESQVARAIDYLGMTGQFVVEATSSFYATAPVGDVEQPDYVNAVCRVSTALTPFQALHALLDAERELGRVRSGKLRNQPRVIDFDLLLYGDVQMSVPELQLPHPRMHERRFVLEPMAEIDQNLEIPGHGIVSRLLAECQNQQVTRIEFKG